MSLIAVNICLVGNGFEAAALPLSRALCPGPDNTVSRNPNTNSDNDANDDDNDDNDNNSNDENNNHHNNSSANFSDGSA